MTMYFKDIISGDPLFFHHRDYKLVSDCLYEVKCNHVWKQDGHELLLGAESGCMKEFESGASQDVTLDVVRANDLVLTWYSKEDYEEHLWHYFKNLMNQFAKQGLSEIEIEERRERLELAGRIILERMDETDNACYTGSSNNPHSMMAFLEFRQKCSPGWNGDNDKDLYLMFFKDGLELIDY